MGREYDGIEQENGRQVARRLIEKGGLTEDTIAMLSGLTLEEVMNLKYKLAEEVAPEEFDEEDPWADMWDEVNKDAKK